MNMYFKTICLAIFTSLLIQTSSFCQEPATNQFRHEIKMDYTQLFFNKLFLGYEHYFDGFSLSINPALLLKEQTYEQSLGIIADGQFRWYAFFKQQDDQFIQFSSVFFGPYLQYAYGDYQYTDNYDPGFNQNYYYNTLAGGLVTGIKISALEKMILEFYLGGGVKYTFDNPTLQNNNFVGFWEPRYTGMYPRAGLVFAFRL